MLQRFFKSLFNNKPMRKSAPARRLRLEALESRWVPAVTASVAGGVLTVTETTAAADAVTITEQATHGSYTVTGATVNGNVAFNATNVTSIVVDLGTGGDSLALVGNLTANNVSGLDGTLQISDASAFTVSMTAGWNVLGATTINHTSTTTLGVVIDGPGTSLGSLTVFDADGASAIAIGQAGNTSEPAFKSFISLNLGAGDSTTQISDATIGGFLSVVGTAGNDTVSVANSVIGGTPATASSPRPNIGLDVGAGTNSIVIATSSVVGNIFAFSAGSAGNETFVLAGVNLLGFVTYNKTAGATALQSQVVNSNIGGFVSFVSQGGDDQVTIDNTSVAGVANNGAAGIGNVAMNLGTGTNTLTVINGTSILGDLQFGITPTVTGTTGTDTVNIDSTSVFGTVTINNSSSAGAVTVDIGNGGNTFIGKALSIVTGAGADVVRIDNVRVIGNTALVLGDGANTTTVETAADNESSTFLGTFNYTGGAGVDTVTLGFAATDEARFASAVSLLGGAGNDVFVGAFADYLGNPAATEDFEA